MMGRERLALAALRNIQEKVNEQSDDPILWATARNSFERHLQNELKTLHDRIEIYTISLFERMTVITNKDA